MVSESGAIISLSISINLMIGRNESKDKAVISEKVVVVTHLVRERDVLHFKGFTGTSVLSHFITVSE